MDNADKKPERIIVKCVTDNEEVVCIREKGVYKGVCPKCGTTIIFGDNFVEAGGISLFLS